MNLQSKVSAVLALALVAACDPSGSVSELPVINLDVAEERSFDISEIMDEVQIVRLETNEQSLFGYASFLVSEKYIIAISRDKIIQFTSDGTFLRVLAQRGQGPGEYLDVWTSALNQAGDKLYFDHRGDNTVITSFDLTSGTFDGVIPKPLQALGVEGGFYLSKMLILNDQFYCVPAAFYLGQQSLYIQNASSELLQTFPRTDKPMTGGASVSGDIYLEADPEMGNVLYMDGKRDTVYSISDEGIEPYLVVSYAGKFDFDSQLPEVTGKLVSLVSSGESGMLFVSSDGIVKRMSGGSSASEKSAGLYYVDSERVPVRVSKIDWDNLELPSEIRFKQIGGYLTCPIPIENFKPMLQQAIENSSGDPAALQRWQTLDAQITENDNPILIVGKMK